MNLLNIYSESKSMFVYIHMYVLEHNYIKVIGYIAYSLRSLSLILVVALIYYIYKKKVLIFNFLKGKI